MDSAESWLNKYQYTDFYHLLKPIGEGGMGQVFLAEDLRLKRKVAIKLANFSSEEHKQKAIYEAQLLARFNHPNIVQIFDVLQGESKVALVMEYIDGFTLDSYLKQEYTPLEQLLIWLIQLSEALQALHSAQIIHCDLKPQNILITHNRQIKLTDFGISRDIPLSEPSITNIQLGSPHYMAPECFEDSLFDQQSDLFSLGIIAYTLLTQSHPFGVGDSHEVMNNIKLGRNIALTHFASDVPADLVSLISSMIEHDREKRPKSIDDVLVKLRAIRKSYVQHKILSEQTIDINSLSMSEPDDKKNPHAYRFLLSIISVLIAVIFVFLTWLNQDDEFYQVVVLKPKVNIQQPDLLEKVKLISAAVDFSIRESVINEKHMQLVPLSEYQEQTDDYKHIAAITGATDIVFSELNCEIEKCEVVLSRISAATGYIVEQKQWPVPFDNFTDIYLSGKSHFGFLFSTTNNTLIHNKTFSEQNYIDYIALYSAIRIEGKQSEQLLQALELLLQKEPEFYAAYALYREVALNLFVQSQNHPYLTRLNRLLHSAPVTYQLSPLQSIDLFWLAVTRGDMDKAKNELQRAVARGVDKSTQIELEAYYYLSNNDFEKAIEYYLKALKFRPSAVLKYNLALAYWNQGNLAKTKETLRNLLQITPNDYFVNQLLATTYLMTGEVALAITSYEKLLLQEPLSSDLSHLSLAYALNRRYEESKKMAQLAVDKSPDNTSWLINLADAKWLSGERVGAEQLYQQVIMKNANKEDFKSKLEVAQAQAHLGDKTQAIKALVNAQKQASDNAEVAFTSALVYTLIGEYTSAVINTEEALTKGVGAIWFNLPWFDSLCADDGFRKAMKSANNRKRCLPMNEA